MKNIALLIVFATLAVTGCATNKKSKPKFGKVQSDVAALDGTWELNYISGPRIAFEGLYPRKRPTLIVDTAQSGVSGNGSCNSYRGPVEIEGNKIRFDKIAATLMACEGNGESVYFKTLETVTAYSISNDQKELTLLMEDIPVMRFERK